MPCISHQLKRKMWSFGPIIKSSINHFPHSVIACRQYKIMHKDNRKYFLICDRDNSINSFSLWVPLYLLTFKIMKHIHIKDKLKIKPLGTKLLNIYEDSKALLKYPCSANNMFFAFSFSKRKSFLSYRQY